MKRFTRSLFLPCFMTFLLVISHNHSFSQDNADTAYLKLPWKTVATRMSNEWYKSDAAAAVAATVLFCQKSVGGWAKNKPYHHPISEAEKTAVEKSRNEVGATIDNGATITEMRFLAKMYENTRGEEYYTAFEKGLNYLLKAQYNNGGWPQFYPFRTGSTSYASHITYNDNAIVNVLELLKEVAANKTTFASLPIPATLREKSKQAFDKGIACIIATQIKVNGQPTVWCAQHDETTLLPAKARAYELPSFSGQESIGIVNLLMQVDDPSKEIIQSVHAAMAWLDQHKITGIKLVNQPGADGKRNIVVVNDPSATPLVARFYDLETAQPFFCDRDGIKKATLAEIGAERRNGYSWYSEELPRLQKKYAAWQKQLK